MRQLSYLMLGSILVFALSGAAQAADPIMPAPAAPVIAEVQAPVFVEPEVVVSNDFEWTGFYAGLGVGGSWQDYTLSADGVPNDFVVDPTLLDAELVIGGNIQFDRVVWGAEISAGGYRLNGSGNAGDIAAIQAALGLGDFEVDGLPDNTDFDVESSGYTVGLSTRLGYLVTPSVLLYGSAGVDAFITPDGLDVTYDDGAQTANIGFEDGDNRWFGNAYGTIGAGVEVAVAENISLDFEYTYGFSAAGLFEGEIDGLSDFDSGSHKIAAQALFHF